MSARYCTADEAKKLVSYNPETGQIVWLVRPCRNVFQGDLWGGNDGKGYVRGKLNGQIFLAHRLAWLLSYAEWPPGFIDHINGIRHDNRLSNLRIASPQVNQQNQRKAMRTNLCGVLGVSKKPSGKFASYIKASGKNIYLGQFDDVEQANNAYVNAKRKLHAGCTL